jgi:hypothetical protein
METKMPVSAGTGSSVVVNPSRVVIGVDVVTMTSFRDLISGEEYVVSA